MWPLYIRLSLAKQIKWFNLIYDCIRTIRNQMVSHSWLCPESIIVKSWSCFVKLLWLIKTVLLRQKIVRFMLSLISLKVVVILAIKILIQLALLVVSIVDFLHFGTLSIRSIFKLWLHFCNSFLNSRFKLTLIFSFWCLF